MARARRIAHGASEAPDSVSVHALRPVHAEAGGEADVDGAGIDCANLLCGGRGQVDRIARGTHRIAARLVPTGRVAPSRIAPSRIAQPRRRAHGLWRLEVVGRLGRQLDVKLWSVGEGGERVVEADLVAE